MASNLPFAGLRIAEKSQLLTGRLLTQMFADQGADVFLERAGGGRESELDTYFDRNKKAVGEGNLADTSTFDVVVVDGDEPIDRLPGQFVVHIVAALPDDPAYGHLPHDVTEDALNALVGFFTDMGQSSRLLGRPVIYTPLPLCSVYAAVDGANMLGASLIDRQRTGAGRELWVSRLAGGVSAIGALSLTSEGLPSYLTKPPVHIDPTPELKEKLQRAHDDGHEQLKLENSVQPLGTPFPTKDGSMAMCIGAANRGLCQRMLKGMGIYDDVLADGFVDVTPYKPENEQYRGRNLGDPSTLTIENSTKLAQHVAKAYLNRTADEWEEYLCTEWRVPAVKVHSWDEWKNDAGAQQSLIFAPVEGSSERQIGRTAWLDSVRPYPAHRVLESADVAGEPLADLNAQVSEAPHERPLEGLKIADFTDVVAGPNCTRMLAELGASVVRIDPINPQHTPEIMIEWSGESGVGKQTTIINSKDATGRELRNRILADCDVVVANKLDAQWERLGLDRSSLDAIKPGIVQIALAAHRGENADAPRHDYPGYDPALQGTTGIMVRFGPQGCPTFHGLASCVDYLCGYLGTWAGISALFAQNRQRAEGAQAPGDWAETSLSVAATLTQLLLQYETEPASARGPEARGLTPGARVYEARDGWIYAQADSDISDRVADRGRDDILNELAAEGIIAVPVQTCRELADRHTADPTPTVRFHHTTTDGWTVGTFDATWFAQDGKPLGSPRPAHRIGTDIAEVFAEHGLADQDIEDLVQRQIIGAREYANTTDS